MLRVLFQGENMSGQRFVQQTSVAASTSPNLDVWLLEGRPPTFSCPSDKSSLVRKKLARFAFAEPKRPSLKLMPAHGRLAGKPHLEKILLMKLRMMSVDAVTTTASTMSEIPAKEKGEIATAAAGKLFRMIAMPPSLMCLALVPTE
jgi:hypothetical protein